MSSAERIHEYIVDLQQETVVSYEDDDEEMVPGQGVDGVPAPVLEHQQVPRLSEIPFSEPPPGCGSGHADSH